MHYAERVEIGCGQRRPLVLETDAEAGVLAPMIDRQMPTGSQRAMLVGWSSQGAGMQTIHALLVKAGAERVVLEDQLRLTTDRTSAGVVLLTTAKAVRIGIFEPGREVHNPDDWELSFGKVNLDLRATRMLQYTPSAGTDASSVLYRPPLHVGMVGVMKPIAWILVDESGFRLEVPAKAEQPDSQ